MPCYTGAYGTVYPIYGPNAITWPLVYDESVSITQQIAYIMGALNEENNRFGLYLTLPAFREFLDRLDEEQSAQDTALMAYANQKDAMLRAALEKQIENIVAGQLIWNPTKGKMTDSVASTRDMFRWLAVHALTCDQLSASCTVQELAEQSLNVRGVATWSAELMPGWIEPAGIRVM